MHRLLVIPLVVLAACSRSAPPPAAFTPAQSAKLTPRDDRLARLYAASCKACHTVKDSQAPLTGDRAAWNARWTAGEDTLLTRVIQGKQGMPAGGQCFECTPDDLLGIIRFMAGREGHS